MKCPTCKRSFEVETTECKRCGTDLLLITELEKSYRQSLQCGFRKLIEMEHGEARSYFSRALSINSGSKEAVKGMALAELFQSRFKEALGWYTRHKGSQTPTANPWRFPGLVIKFCIPIRLGTESQGLKICWMFYIGGAQVFENIRHILPEILISKF